MAQMMATASRARIVEIANIESVPGLLLVFIHRHGPTRSTTA
jgi:hypothetical protein